MSAILKSMWRRALTPLVCTPRIATSSLTQWKPLCTVPDTPKPQDAIIQQFKSAPTVNDVLTAVQTYLPVMSHKHILQAFRCIFELHKRTEVDIEDQSLVKDPTFSQLCQNFKKHARSIQVNEAIEATKVLTFLGVPVESLVVQTMLQLIRYNINNLTIRQIMFVDFLLSRFETKNHLVDALKLALPLSFQIHLPLEIDNQDLPLLKSMLSFSCAHNLPDRCINNVVTGLLLHDQGIDAAEAKSIIWSLCQINCTEQKYPTRAQLLHICYDIMAYNIDKLSFDEVLRTAAKIKSRILEKHPEYYHEQLMDAVAGYVVKNKVEFEKGLLIARVLSRIAHTHLGLMEYLSDIVYDNPKELSNARINILFGFVNCLSNNHYTAPREKWDVIRQCISSNPVLDTRSSTLPWVKFCLELASLGHFEDKLLNRVFSNQFLEEFLDKDTNTLDYLQLFTLQEAVNTFYSQDYQLPADVLRKAKDLYPLHAMTDQLEASLVQGLGDPSYVLKNVVLPNGIVADLMLALQGGRPMPLPRAPGGPPRVPFAELALPGGSVVVAILNFHQGCFSMNSNRLRGTFRLVLDILEKQGFAAVPINIHEWTNAPDHEKTPYLLREVGYKCGEIGIKLTIYSEAIYAHVVWNNEELDVDISDYYTDMPKSVAKAKYSNEINQTGWAFLEIVTNRAWMDEKQAFAAGFIEGHLTHDLIWLHWQNMLKTYCHDKADVCGLIEEFLDYNEAYLVDMIDTYSKDPYWYHVKLYYIQLQGLTCGYNEATKGTYKWLTFRDIMWINMLGDLDELALSLSMPKMRKGELFPHKVKKSIDDMLMMSDHCTGLVKLLPDQSNLYTAHVTWNSYQSMLRLHKMYVLYYKAEPTGRKFMPGWKMSMSSYPGFVQSTDDFYIISSGLVVAETTIGNSNRTLFEGSGKPRGQILEFVRTMVANRLATTGSEWVTIFRRHNSGTYNNQWYMVDYKKFTPRTATCRGSIEPGLLWVLEQLPGHIHAADLTNMLIRNTYFPSYNIAFFPCMFNLSGGNERIQAYGDWFGYHTNPRSAILREKQAEINNLHDMYNVMRYNDFKFDPNARCEQCDPPYSGCNAIAARNDLNPANGTYPFRAIGHRSHGATDAKITSAYMYMAYQFLAVCSPTYNISRGIPPFKWSEFDLGASILHLGHPDEWLFSPVLHKWEWG